jgi:hypothetical protein
MWIFTRYGFFSVVCAKAQDGVTLDESTLMVRARVRGHLERLLQRFPALRCNIVQTKDTDYAYRIIVDKDVWRWLLGELASEIDYGNFKHEVVKQTAWPASAAYTTALYAVWSLLRRLQLGEERRVG